MNAFLRHLSLLGGRRRSIVVLLAALALIAQWSALAIVRRAGPEGDSGPWPISLAVVSSLIIALLGAALYVALGRRRDAEQEPPHTMTTDVLTGILNRRGFMGAAGQEFTRSVRYDRPLSFLAIDIDRFKAINDRYGHAASDSVLQAFALALQSVLRTTDTVGRTGDEAFNVLLPETGATQAIELAQRVRLACEAAKLDFLPPGQTVTVSVGVASVGTGDSSIEHALSRADNALQRAKTAGRNRVEIA